MTKHSGTPGREGNIILEVLKRHGINDPDAYLDKHKNAPIDSTLRIDGVPLGGSVKAARRAADKLKLL